MNDTANDKTMPEVTDPRGFYKKFEVNRLDGSDLPGGKHYGCEYLVIDLTHDEEGKKAALVYASLVSSKRPALAEDLREKLTGIEPTTQPEPSVPLSAVQELLEKVKSMQSQCASAHNMGESYRNGKIDAYVEVRAVITHLFDLLPEATK